MSDQPGSASPGNESGIEHSPLMQQFAQQLKRKAEHEKHLASITPDDYDREFVKAWNKEDGVRRLYQIRYICEEHYKSPIAKEIEQMCIDLTRAMMKLESRCGVNVGI